MAPRIPAYVPIPFAKTGNCSSVFEPFAHNGEHNGELVGLTWSVGTRIGGLLVSCPVVSCFDWAPPLIHLGRDHAGTFISAVIFTAQGFGIDCLCFTNGSRAVRVPAVRRRNIVRTEPEASECRRLRMRVVAGDHPQSIRWGDVHADFTVIHVSINASLDAYRCINQLHCHAIYRT